MPAPNPQLREQIALLSDGNRTFRQIADAVGRSESYVAELVREMGLPRRHRGTGKTRQRSPESLARIERIRELADGERTSKEIARIVESSEKYVQRVMLDLDLQRRPQGAQLGLENPAFAGGRRIDRDGYAVVTAPIDHPHARIAKGKNVGHIREHRLVAERALGRYLQDGEVVDHIDGLHLHNDPANLRVFASNSDHLKATISGQIPNWSDQGLENMRLPRRQLAGLTPVDSYRIERARGDVRLRQILLAWLRFEQESPYLLGTRRWLERAGILDTSRSSLELHLLRLSSRFGDNQMA